MPYRQTKYILVHYRKHWRYYNTSDKWLFVCSFLDATSDANENKDANDDGNENEDENDQENENEDENDVENDNESRDDSSKSNYVQIILAY